jgi:hypothetical protein
MRFGTIKDATYGLVFFATPHRGGNGVTLAKLAAQVVTGVSGSSRNDLLRSLQGNSLFNEESAEYFRHQLEDYHVLSLSETKKTRYKGRGIFSVFKAELVSRPTIAPRSLFLHLWQLVVNSTSSKLGLAGSREHHLLIEADHSQVCKFAGKDHSYEPVGRNIKKLVEGAIKTCMFWHVFLCWHVG